MTNRIHAHNPSIGTASLEHTANTTHSAATTNANGTHPVHRTSSRGSDVIGDSGSQTNAQARLRAMQQRASVSGSAATGGSQQANAFEAMVRDYRTQMLAGRTPAAPSAPPLPHMRGMEIMAHVGIQHPDFGRGLREAQHAAHANRPFSPVEWLFEHATSHAAQRYGVSPHLTGAVAELTVHTGVELAEMGLHLGTEVAGEVLGEAAAHSAGVHALHLAAGGASIVGTVLTAVAIADSASMLTQEMVNIARGHFVPTPAVLDAIRAEIPRRAAAWVRDQSVRAEASFSAGARRAAQGLAPETSRLGDRAYMLGVEQGRAYRTANGDAYSRVVQHNHAMAQARRDVDAMPHGSPASASPAASTTTSTVRPTPAEHFVPVTQLERDHVGVDIHIDG